MKTMTDVQQKKKLKQQQQEPNHKKSGADCGYFLVSSLQLKNIIIYNHTYFSKTHYYIWVNTLFFPTVNLASYVLSSFESV